MRRRIVVIHNPIAGRRRKRRLAETMRLLRERCDVTFLSTGAAGEAESLAARISPEDCDAIVVAGGDGTINEVVNGLAAGAPPLGLIPLGTANVFAREIGMMLPPAPLARAIAEAPACDINYATANGRRFVQMAGIGFDARVVGAVDPAWKRRLGRGAYGGEIVRQWLGHVPRRYRVMAAGASLEASTVIVANGRYYGGPFVVDPDASPWRGRLSVAAFLADGRGAVLRYLLALGTGRLAGRRDVRMIETTEVAVAGPAGEPVQVDGDIRAALPCRIAMGAFPIRVLAIRGASDRR